MPQILIFTGTRKSSGKTLLAVNTAVAAGRAGQSVTFFETGPSHHSAASYVGANPVHNLNDLAWGYCSAPDVFVPCGANADLILAGEPIGWSDEEKVSRMLDVAPILEEKDFLIVDAAGGLLEYHLPILPWACDIFVVVTPEQVAAGEALWFIHNLCNRAPGKPINVILNRVRLQETAETICSRLEHDFGRILHLPLVCVGIVAEDPEILAASDKGVPCVLSCAPSPASDTIERLVESAIRSRSNRDEQPSLSEFLRNLFRCIDLETASCATDALRQIARDADPEISEEEVALFRDLILGALEARNQGSLDFKNLYSFVRQQIAAGKETNPCQPYPW